MAPRARRRRPESDCFGCAFIALWFFGLIGVEAAGGFGHELITLIVFVGLSGIGYNLARRIG